MCSSILNEVLTINLKFTANGLMILFQESGAIDCRLSASPQNWIFLHPIFHQKIQIIFFN